jgi:hypothetical protein
MADKALAWLEKQDKSNMGISETTKQELEDNLNNALEKETPESCNEFLDEQKPADTEKGAKGNEREIPNSSWSKEDERILVEMLKIFNIEKFEGYNIGENNEDALKFLKSLKERVQQKQEWSEENEEKINEIIDYLDYKGHKTDVEFLKSLRGRFTWRPSEGQLECLGYTIEKAEKNWSPLTNNRVYLTLNELKKQLEKL